MKTPRSACWINRVPVQAAGRMLVATVYQFQQPHPQQEGYAQFTLRDIAAHEDVTLGMSQSQDVECQILVRLCAVDSFATTTYSNQVWPDAT